MHKSYDEDRIDERLAAIKRKASQNLAISKMEDRSLFSWESYLGYSLDESEKGAQDKWWKERAKKVSNIAYLI